MAYLCEMEGGFSRCVLAAQRSSDRWYLTHWDPESARARTFWRAVTSGDPADVHRAMLNIAKFGGQGGEVALKMLEESHSLDLLSLEYPEIVPALMDVRSRRKIVQIQREDVQE